MGGDLLEQLDVVRLLDEAAGELASDRERLLAGRGGGDAEGVGSNRVHPAGADGDERLLLREEHHSLPPDACSTHQTTRGLQARLPAASAAAAAADARVRHLRVLHSRSQIHSLFTIFSVYFIANFIKLVSGALEKMTGTYLKFIVYLKI